MKKYIFILAITGLVAAACSKEAPTTKEQASEVGTYTFVLNASVAGDATKTSYANDKTFSWTKGDQISVMFHNGDDNKYFTLSAVSGGASAKFSGEITNGYTIGASDAEGGAKYALFPAGAHGWNTTDHRPIFNIPAVTDFTAAGAHFSANLPMCAVGDNFGNFEFAHIACAYKYTFTNIDNSITKVRLKVTHNQTHKLSGNFPLNPANKWYAQWADAGSADQSVSYIVNVKDNKAVFYFSIGKDSESSFQPTITLSDEVSGFVLYNATAKTAWSADNIKPLESRMVVLPEISTPGLGSPLISAYGINWNSVTCKADGDAGTDKDAIRTIKATADAGHVYLYLEVLNDKLYSDTSYQYSDRSYLYIGDGSAGSSSKWTQDSQNKIEGWLKYYGDPQFINWAGIIEGNRANATIAGGVAYFEMAIKRSAVTCLQTSAASTAYVGFMVTSCYNTGSTLGSKAEIGYAPAQGGSMLAVDIPAYAAP